MKLARGAHALALALLLAACVGSSAKDEQQARERLKSYVLGAVPADVGQKLDVSYEDKVVLLGARVEPGSSVRPGQQVKITMYWQCKQALGSGWNLFTHVVDGSGERLINIDNVGPLREAHDGQQALPPGAWEAGKVYVDEQSFAVPNNVKTDRIQVVTGIWKGDGRLKAVSGPHDATNRGIAATLTLDGKPPQPKVAPIPALRVDKLAPDAKIKIDGKLDEEAWQSAPGSGPLVDVRTGEPNKTFPVNGSVKLLWNDEGIYVGFSVSDPDIIGGFKKTDKDPHLWTKDTVEIMADPDGEGDNKDYYEIQIGPQNLVFDSQFDDYNQPKVEPDGPFGHQDWSVNAKSAVVVDGTVDKSDDKDKGYTVEALLPWKSFSKAKHVPPELGTSWRMNFYAMKSNGGVAWSPILGQGNFHKAPRFGRVLWAEKGWNPPAAPVAGAPSAAPPASAAVPAASTLPVGSAGAVASVRPPAVAKPPATKPSPALR